MGSTGADPTLVAADLDEEAKRLQLQAFKTSLRKQISQDQKSQTDAQTPSTDFKPLQGTVDVGAKVGEMADLLAHSVLRQGARKIATELKNMLPAADEAKVLVVEDRALITSDWSYRIVVEPLSHHYHALWSVVRTLHLRLSPPERETELPPEAPPAPPFLRSNLRPMYMAAPAEHVVGAAVAGAVGVLMPAAVGIAGASAVIGNLATLVGMFKTDYSITSRDMTIGGTPLVAALVHELRSGKDSPTVGVDQFRVLETSHLLQRFYGAWSLRAALQYLAERLSDEQGLAFEDKLAENRWSERKDMAAAYTKALGDGASTEAVLAQLKARLEDLDVVIKEAVERTQAVRALVGTAANVGSHFDTFAEAVITPPKDGAYSPLVAAAMRERLHDAGSGWTHVVFVAAEAGGGEMVTKHNAFGRSGEVAFLGGCQVSWLLYDVKHDETLAGGTEPLLARMDYRLDGHTKPSVDSISFALEENIAKGTGAR